MFTMISLLPIGLHVLELVSIHSPIARIHYMQVLSTGIILKFVFIQWSENLDTVILLSEPAP